MFQYCITMSVKFTIHRNVCIQFRLPILFLFCVPRNGEVTDFYDTNQVPSLEDATSPIGVFLM